ncbi:MAG TPA: rod shape-determining protein MreC [Gaiellaceae bacterium]|nr:rod shape-determining protein MreC [Gaiellaceae bacterium]
MVVGILTVLSLALLSVYFRESDEGPLHDAQSAGAAVLKPFQVGAERVARPFRDLYGWSDGLVGAKDENERLQAQVERLQQQVIENQTAAQENRSLRDQLAFQDLPGIGDYRHVNTRVISHPPSQNEKEVVIAAGTDDGVRVDAPVLSDGALVGKVSEVTGSTALVTLITDETSAVAARDLSTGASGLVVAGPGDSLLLDRVTKASDVAVGDLVITAGSRVGRLPSLFPRGIPIGFVTSVNQTDTDPFKHVQIEPMGKLDSLYAVTVLVR